MLNLYKKFSANEGKLSASFKDGTFASEDDQQMVMTYCTVKKQFGKLQESFCHSSQFSIKFAYGFTFNCACC